MGRVSNFLFAFGIFLIVAGLFFPKTANIYQKFQPQSPAPSPVLKTEDKAGGVLVSRVYDGDTVETSAGEKIRYLGINAPETGEPFSRQATDKNKELVLNKNIRLEFDVEKKDRFGRTLAYVFVGDKNTSIELVSLGLATVETIPPNVKYQKEILSAQKSARSSCLGIWKDLCSKTSSVVLGASSNCIKIKTINADAPGNDNLNKNGEWIKIGNSCPNSVSMDNWLLKDNSSSNRYTFKNFTLNSNSDITIFSGCGQDLGDKLYWQCPERKYAIWNNTSDHAFLYNEKGELVSDYEY